jgi:UDP-N-acetyl-D-glucosamine dehydrogenase
MKNKKITIIGLGYVGLPLAILTSYKGLNVQGYDINADRLIAIKERKIKIEDSFVNKLGEEVKLNVSNVLDSSEIYIVCVPTPVDERTQPNLSPLKGAINSICNVLQDNQLIIIESTIYPGMCEEEIMPILDKTGKKYFLAHCPERINPGDLKWNVNNISRIVGGINSTSTETAVEFYRHVVDADVKSLSNIRNAEATKVLENIFRDVNTALVNEMAQSFYRMGIDIKEVIDAASTKPFAYMPHYPGVGVGGHCIAVDPYYMIEKGRAAGFDHELLKIARRINSNMPIYTVTLLQNTLNQLGLSLKNRKVGVYGLAYKPNVNDIRESPSFEIIKRLRNYKEAEVEVYDPYVKEQSTVGSFKELVNHAEAIVVCTAHDELNDIDYNLFKESGIKIIIDGRNCLDREKIVNMGITYRGIGRNESKY